MGSNNEDCNRQGSKLCPSFSDACAVVVGHDSESSNTSGVAFLSLALSLAFSGFLPGKMVCLPISTPARMCLKKGCDGVRITCKNKIESGVFKSLLHIFNI